MGLGACVSHCIQITHSVVAAMGVRPLDLAGRTICGSGLSFRMTVHRCRRDHKSNQGVSSSSAQIVLTDVGGYNATKLPTLESKA